jgi:hypothetical protein
MEDLRKRILRSGLVIFLGLLPAIALAQGGPPMLTDDPDTPGPGYWEINLSSIFNKFRSETHILAPYADINYGVGKRIQLKFEIPWLTVHQEGQSNGGGPGDSIVGLKWRFFGHEGKWLAWSTYPQLEAPTGNWTARRGIENEGWQFLLPTEFTFQIKRVELNGEAGRNFTQMAGNGWIAGLLTEVEFHPHFELLAEAHADQAGQGPTELTANFGARVKLTEQLVLLTSAGHDVHGAPEDRALLHVYLGLQFNLPRQYQRN